VKRKSLKTESQTVKNRFKNKNWSECDQFFLTVTIFQVFFFFKTDFKILVTVAESDSYTLGRNSKEKNS